MSFFLITRGDGLLVKALECCQKGCEFKPYLEHLSFKKIPILGIQKHMMWVDKIC
jgi:hypothetical protein